ARSRLRPPLWCGAAALPIPLGHAGLCAQLLELRLRCRRHSRPGGGGATRSVRDDRDELGLRWSLLPDLRAAGSGDAGGGRQASARRGAVRTLVHRGDRGDYGGRPGVRRAVQRAGGPGDRADHGGGGGSAGQRQSSECSGRGSRGARGRRCVTARATSPTNSVFTLYSHDSWISAVSWPSRPRDATTAATPIEQGARSRAPQTSTSALSKVEVSMTTRNFTSPATTRS